MRLWTVHPKYLDTQGLTGLWREGLLAQAVLLGKTIGYREHPQLDRFKAHPDPIGAIAQYLLVIHAEAHRWGYNFDREKIKAKSTITRINSTRGQLMYEWEHLLNKLKTRSPDVHQELQQVTQISPNPIFEIIPGDIEDWEKLE
jgi:hypothetical protein